MHYRCVPLFSVCGKSRVHCGLGRVTLTPLLFHVFRDNVWTHLRSFTQMVPAGLGYLRLAAAAVILAEPAGTFQVAWRGQLPMACQTPFRAELLAGSVALRLSTQVWLFSDCKAFVTVAKRTLQSKRSGQPLCLPRENADLWAYFAESLDGLDADKSDVIWVKGHASYQACYGLSKIHAWFNHWADRTAHATVMQAAKHPLFQDLCAEFRKKVSLARDLASYQAGVGMILQVRMMPPLHYPLWFSLL